MIREITTEEDMKHILPAARRWAAESNIKDFNLKIEPQYLVNELLQLLHKEQSVLLTDENYNGFMGLRLIRSPFSSQLICDEHYWYIIPEKRGRNALEFFKYALKWAKEKGCSHIMMHSSSMASDLPEKVNSFYKRMGMRQIETYFLKEVD